jgi:hypothetical protein
MPKRLTAEAMREAARYFGRQGGQKRARKLTAEERRAIARKAAHARWAKTKGTRP